MKLMSFLVQDGQVELIKELLGSDVLSMKVEDFSLASTEPKAPSVVRPRERRMKKIPTTRRMPTLKFYYQLGADGRTFTRYELMEAISAAGYSSHNAYVGINRLIAVGILEELVDGGAWRSYRLTTTGLTRAAASKRFKELRASQAAT